MYVLKNELNNWVFTPGVRKQGTLEINSAHSYWEFAEIWNVTRNIPFYTPNDPETAISTEIVGSTTVITFETNTNFCSPDEEIKVLLHNEQPGATTGPASNVAVTNFPSIQTIAGSVEVINELEIKNDVDNPIPVSGDINVTNEVEIKNDLDNPIAVQGTVSIASSQVIPVTVSYPPGSTAGFGENLTAEITPLGQYDAIYGLGGDAISEYETYDLLGGFAGTNGSTFIARTSEVQYSYGVLRSRRFLRYRPGQSATGRFTAMFSTGVAGTEQRAGLFNQESAFMVGYNGESFGILHSYGAQAAIATLTVTGTTITSSNATVTLNGVPFSVPLVAGESEEQTAARISAFTFGGWNTQQIDNVVTFASQDTSTKPGAFSFTHADATGVLVLDRQGVSPTDIWIPQTSWNVDTLNGAGPSGMDLDPTKLNVFQIRYKWLGAGSVSFMVEDSVSGKNIEFHKLIWSNQNTEPHIANPSLKIGYVAYNLVGGVGSQVEVRGSSMMIGVDGQRRLNHYPRSVAVSKSGLSNDNTDPDDIHHIITILNPLVVNGKINTRELVLNTASLSAVASKPTNFLVYLNSSLMDGVVNTFRSLPETHAVYCTIDGYVDGTIYTPLTISAIVGGGQTGGQKDLDLNQYNIVIPAGSKITICARSSTNITELTAALTWTVD